MSTIQQFQKFINEKYILFPIIGFFTLWSFPNVLSSAAAGLDPSWQIALHMAKIQGLVWGQDIVVTFGPLGYLFLKININQEFWIHSFLYKIIVHILYFIIISVYCFTTKNKLYNLLAFGTLSILLVNLIPNYYPLVGLILGFYLYQNKLSNKLFLIPLSFTPAFFAFVKGDVFLGSLSILISAWLILIFKKRYKDFIISLIVYPSSLVFLWLSMDFPVSEMINYFSNLLATSSGYVIAMSIDKLFYPVYFSIPFWLIFFWWIYNSYKKGYDLSLFFLCSGPSFLLYKLGIVREGGHALHYFLFWSVIFLIILIWSQRYNFPKIQKWITFIAILFLISSAYFTGYVLLPNEKYTEINSEFFSNGIVDAFQKASNPYLKSKIFNIGTYLSYVESDSNFEKIRHSEKSNILKFYADYPKSILNKINNSSIDIIPWDNALIYAHDYNWKPRPILQSYSAYNPKLDNLDAKFLSSENAPNQLLYSWKSIDGRFSAFDTPASLRAILCNYKIIEHDYRTTLFNKDKNKCLEPISILNQTISFDQSTFIPKVDDGYLFAKIHIKQNALGKLSDFVYKSPHVRIQINDNEFHHRFIYPNAENGIILSGNPVTPLLLYDVEKFTLHSTHPNYFDDKIEIEYFTINLFSD